MADKQENMHGDRVLAHAKLLMETAKADRRAESKKALRDADRRFRIASENLSKFSPRVRDVGDRNTIPASYNDGWCERSDECQEALAALNKIVDSILRSR